MPKSDKIVQNKTFSSFLIEGVQKSNVTDWQLTLVKKLLFGFENSGVFFSTRVNKKKRINC